MLTKSIRMWCREVAKNHPAHTSLVWMCPRGGYKNIDEWAKAEEYFKQIVRYRKRHHVE